MPYSKSCPPIQLASATLSWGIQILESCRDYHTIYTVLQQVLRRVSNGATDTFEVQSRLNVLQVICVAMLNSKRILEIEGQVSDLVSSLYSSYKQLERASGTRETRFGMHLRRQLARSLKLLVVATRTDDISTLYRQRLDVLNQAISRIHAVSVVFFGTRG